MPIAKEAAEGHRMLALNCNRITLKKMLGFSLIAKSYV
jgi:hypothetical protein